jgi:hypothetical protein
MPYDLASSPTDPQYQSLTGCLARAFWIVIGNLFLALCLLAVVRTQSQGFALADGVFWGVCLLQVLLYFADIRWLDGERVLKSTRPRNPYRFPLIFGAVCLTAWLLARLVAYLLS